MYILIVTVSREKYDVENWKCVTSSKDTIRRCIHQAFDEFGANHIEDIELYEGEKVDFKVNNKTEVTF